MGVGKPVTGRLGRCDEAGLSLVEVLVAVVVLTVGVLAMAGSTGVAFTRLRVADHRNERAAALQYASEGLRAVPYANLGSECSALAETVGAYELRCAVGSAGANLTRLYIVSVGPGHVSGYWRLNVVDSTAISIAR